MTMVNDGTVTEEALVAATTNDVAFLTMTSTEEAAADISAAKDFEWKCVGVVDIPTFHHYRLGNQRTVAKEEASKSLSRRRRRGGGGTQNN